MSRHLLWPIWLSVKWLIQCKRGIRLCSYTLLMSIAIIGSFSLQDREPPGPYKILRGHKYHIRAAAFSPDGKTLVTGGGLFAEASELIFWDLSASQPRLRFAGSTGQVSYVTFSSDAQIMATSGYDHVVRIWDCTSGLERLVLRGHNDSVHALAFSKDNRTLASASRDDTIRLWDVQSGIEQGAFAAPAGWIHCLAFPEDGPMVATGGGRDLEVRVWSLATGQIRARFPGPASGMVCMAFSTDGNLLAGGCMDGAVLIWDLRTHKVCHRSGKRDSPTTAVVFSRTGDFLACGSLRGGVGLWPFALNHEWDFFEGHLDVVTALSFSPDNKTLASASTDRTAILWKVDKLWLHRPVESRGRSRD